MESCPYYYFLFGILIFSQCKLAYAHMDVVMTNLPPPGLFLGRVSNEQIVKNASEELHGYFKFSENENVLEIGLSFNAMEADSGLCVPLDLRAKDEMEVARVVHVTVGA